MFQIFLLLKDFISGQKYLFQAIREIALGVHIQKQTFHTFMLESYAYRSKMST